MLEMPTRRRSTHGRAVNANLVDRTSMAAWYRYRVALTNISGKCSNWADQSGNTRPLLQATAANRPTVNSDGSLTFDGAAGSMAATFTLSQPLTYYIAFRQNAWAASKVIIDGVSAAVSLTQTTASPGIAASAGTALTVDNTAKIGSNAVACFVANGTTSVYQVGGGAATVTTSGSANTNNAGGITIGSDRSTANFASVTIYEVIAYSVAHDATTRLRILRYLARVSQVGGVM